MFDAHISSLGYLWFLCLALQVPVQLARSKAIQSRNLRQELCVTAAIALVALVRVPNITLPPLIRDLIEIIFAKSTERRYSNCNSSHPERFSESTTSGINIL